MCVIMFFTFRILSLAMTRIGIKTKKNDIKFAYVIFFV